MDDPEETFGGDGDASPAPYEELVSVMAGGLYGELERLVGVHGPTAVSGLLPQVVSVLEALQEACGQVRDRDQALERLRDDRLRLLEQYERERAGHKQPELSGRLIAASSSSLAVGRGALLPDKPQSEKLSCLYGPFSGRRV
ncbi:C-Jun-amino-terminal kinase-interacting protein 4-like [Crotalus adamanteus]|uniref:C-Jun-amino-terminal kinase-interacting protein 4-like n=1 Tax=Crotalus adamanteus TaxID=8729 RepID=A0AAW1B0K7_CROAD